MPNTSSQPLQNAIEIRDLSFFYGTFKGLKNVNLNIAEHKVTAFIGPSGCGKSTLAKLLQGFYPPEDGGISIDGRDIRHLSANELRQYYGVVPQETVLFANTVYENLVMASPHAAFEEVMQACRMAEIHEVIEQLPQGYQTWLGEHGVGLSGGQKQRVAIARALLKRVYGYDAFRGLQENVIADVLAAAKPGEVVLFSPAAASFDQYRDFEDRGAAFRAAVAAL